jgi:hypothetical protein
VGILPGDHNSESQSVAITWSLVVDLRLDQFEIGEGVLVILGHHLQVKGIRLRTIRGGEAKGSHRDRKRGVE